MTKKRGKKKTVKLKKRVKILFVLILIIILLQTNFFGLYKNKTISKFNIVNIYEKAKEEKDKARRKKIYDDCIKSGLTDENFNEDTKNKKQEVINFINRNNIYYYYQDKTYNYEIKIKEDEALYGASLVKLSTALYLIDNDVDLSIEKKYESRFKSGFSTGMSKHKIGDMVSLGELMKYSITYSDNTAHQMLYDYIGKDKLQEYSKSLGAKVLLEGWDHFGNQTASDMNIYLNRAYELFTEKENGKLLKEYMNNTDTNALNFDDVSFLHKYGSYGAYFHDVGIYLGDHPYNVSILTQKGESAGPSYVTKLSRLTYDFHKAYYDNLESYCHYEAYEKE